MLKKPGSGRERLLRRLQRGPSRNRDNESVRRRRRATLELKMRNQKRALLRDQKKISAHVTSTSSMPQSPSRLVSQSDGIKKEIGSKASLRACSARIEKFPSDDQYLQATRDSEKFDTQEPEKLTAHVTTSKPRSPEM